MPTLEGLLAKLELPAVTGLDECFERAKRQHGCRGNAIFSEVDPQILGKYADEVIAAGSRLSEDSDNALYAYFLAELMAMDDADNIRALSCPHAARHSVDFDILPMFSILWRVPYMIAEHKRRGIPEDVTEATVGMMENQIGDFVTLFGHVGISTFTTWLYAFVVCRIIRVGRFNLEVRKFPGGVRFLRHGSEILPLSDGLTYHRSGRVLGSRGCEDGTDAFTPLFSETEEYFEGAVADGQRCSRELGRFYKSDGWELILSEGDPVVSVHIPTGGPLTEEACHRDLVRGGEIIRGAFGDFKAYFCSSWLLDPQLKGIIGRESNITRFADRFTRYPIKSSATDVVMYVWGVDPSTPAERLPDYNRFANAVRAHLLSGGLIYGAAGIFTEP